MMLILQKLVINISMIHSLALYAFCVRDTTFLYHFPVQISKYLLISLIFFLTTVIDLIYLPSSSSISVKFDRLSFN